MASIQPLIEKEHTRLRTAINFWILEHSKLQNILNNCHADLISERRKILALERKIVMDSQAKMDLRKKLAHYEKLASTGHLEFAEEPSSCNSFGQETRSAQEKTIPRVPGSSDSLVTVGLSTKLRNVDQYASALRMTLTTRKELRDQKKIAKFWKSKATIGGQQGLITPSVSAISSIRETLPAERQAALDALISRRGLTSGLRQLPSNEDTTYSELPSKTMVELMSSSDAALPSLMSTLPSFLSKSSTGSRLSPLASESMKAEVNLMFGSRESSKRLSLPPRMARSGSDPISASERAKSPPPTKVHQPQNANASFSIESFGDLNVIFERAFGTENVVKRHDSAQSTKNASDTRSFELGSSSFLRDIPSLSSSFLAISAIPSGSSQTFGENLTTFPCPQHLTVDTKAKDFTAHPGMKQASKDCTSRRSWQRYTITKSNRSSGEQILPSKKTKQKAGPRGKENQSLSISLPVFKKRHSRLPVPAFMKSGS